MLVFFLQVLEHLVLSVVFVVVVLLVGAVCRKLCCPTLFCPTDLGGSYVSVRLEENIAEVAELSSMKSVSAPVADLGGGGDTGAPKHEKIVLEEGEESDEVTAGTHKDPKGTGGSRDKEARGGTWRPGRVIGDRDHQVRFLGAWGWRLCDFRGGEQSLSWGRCAKCI